MKHKIYLAGPIAGLTYDGATEWRQQFSKEMNAISTNVFCASPMRAKEYLKGTTSFKTEGYEEFPLSTNRGIMTRDHWDCMTADIIVANLVGADRVSIGTVMEMAWAHAYRKPLILLMEKEGNVHQHGLLLETVGFRANTVSDAVSMAYAILEAE